MIHVQKIKINVDRSINGEENNVDFVSKLIPAIIETSLGTVEAFVNAI